MTDSTIIAELKPCGFVLTSQLYKYFSLQCAYCQRLFGRWTTFIAHLKENHLEGIPLTCADVEEVEKTLEEDITESARHNFEEQSSDVIIEIENGADPSPQQFDAIEFIEKDENEHCEYNVDDSYEEAESTKRELKLNLSVDDDATFLFILLYNDYPSLWPLHCSRSVYRQKRICDKNELLDSLTEYNFIVSMETLEFSIKELHNFYSDVVQRLEKGLKISDIEKQYYEACNFLKPFTRVASTAEISFTKQDETNGTVENYREDTNPVGDFQYASTYQNCSENSEEDMTPSEGIKGSNPIGDYQNCSRNSEEEPTLSECIKLSNPIGDFQYASTYENCSGNSEEDLPPSEDIKDSNQFDSTYPNCSGNDEEDLTPSGGIKVLVNFSYANKPTCDFLQCCQEYPCLWDTEHVEYDDEEAQLNALSEINQFFVKKYKSGFTKYTLRSAITRLLNFYKRCCYAKRIIQPARHFYYEQCAFLSGIETKDKVVEQINSNKKISFAVIDNYTLYFIDLCAKYPMLWDRAHPDYSVQKSRQIAYNEIFAQIEQIYQTKLCKDDVYDSIYKMKQFYNTLQIKKQANTPFTKTELVYLEHLKYLSTSTMKVQCHVCERVLRSELTLKTHLLKMHNIGELPYKCDYCEQRFAHRSMLKEHEVRTHTKQYRHQCQYCNKGFVNRREKEDHELVHTGERNAVCEHCGKNFRLKQQLTEHMKTVHERIRRFKCTMCPKQYLHKNQFQDHIKSHLNIRDKICKICGKTFTNFNTLFRHKQLHSDIKRYECKLCGKRFHQCAGLSTHMKRKHELINNKL